MLSVSVSSWPYHSRGDQQSGIVGMMEYWNGGSSEYWEGSKNWLCVLLSLDGESRLKEVNNGRNFD